MQLDFSAAFDRGSHSGLLYKLRDVEVGNAGFDVIARFLSDRAQSTFNNPSVFLQYKSCNLW